MAGTTYYTNANMPNASAFTTLGSTSMTPSLASMDSIDYSKIAAPSAGLNLDSASKLSGDDIALSVGSDIDSGSVLNTVTNGGDVNTPWYQNSGMLSSIAGLGSTLAQLAALPSQIDYYNTQSDALKQNIATAKEEQARRNSNIASFNAHRTPTSAFATA